MKHVPLGKTGLEIPTLCVGTWAFGDQKYWHYGEEHGPSELVETFVAAVESGLSFFDTAEVYGRGESEKILGWLLARARDELAPGRRFVVASKFGLLPGRSGAASLRDALKATLRRLRLETLDLYQIHWPDLRMASVASLMDALADVARDGLARAVGVSNFSAGELREAHAVLAAHGVALASNQVRYNLLDRSPETNGVAEACRELGVTLLAYSPLDQGVLGGRYRRDHRPAAPRGTEPWFRDEAWVRAEVVLEILRGIALREGCGIADVAVAWVLSRGAVPIVGVRSPEHARAIPRALDVALSPTDLSRLDAATA